MGNSQVCFHRHLEICFRCVRHFRWHFLVALIRIFTRSTVEITCADGRIPFSLKLWNDQWWNFSCVFHYNTFQNCSATTEQVQDNCQLSCNKCEVPALSHPGPNACVDYLDMLGLEEYGNQTCSAWVAHGACFEHVYRNESNYFCKKSCSMC